MIPSSSNRTGMPRVRKRRTVLIQSARFREKREMDFVYRISIFLASQSFSIR